LAKAKPANADIVLPKVEFKTAYKMNGDLSKLGMPGAFSDSANFSKMSKEPVKVSFIKQDAAVKINEEGTEAAAVTVGGMEATSIQMPPPIRFVADHPFYYFIRDNQSGVILFAGQVVQP